jgi:hypothetical protein
VLREVHKGMSGLPGLASVYATLVAARHRDAARARPGT